MITVRLITVMVQPVAKLTLQELTKSAIGAWVESTIHGSKVEHHPMISDHQALES